MMHLNTLKGTSLLGHVNKPLVEAFLSLLHEILNLNFNYSYYEIDMDHD
jgi:exportin-7